MIDVGYLLKIIVVIATIICAGLVLYSAKVRTNSTQVVVTCLNPQGTETIRYSGTPNNIRWNSNGTSVSIKTTNGIINIPQFRCDYFEHR